MVKSDADTTAGQGFPEDTGSRSDERFRGRTRTAKIIGQPDSAEAKTEERYERELEKRRGRLNSPPRANGVPQLFSNPSQQKEPPTAAGSGLKNQSGSLFLMITGAPPAPAENPLPREAARAGLYKRRGSGGASKPRRSHLACFHGDC